jgi:hypothetical protein
MPTLTTHFKGNVSGNIASPTSSLSWKFDESFPFLKRIHHICSNDLAMLSIIDENKDVGIIRVIKEDGIQVINSFYIWPKDRGNGHFRNYMGKLCNGPIKFVLRPCPHKVLTEAGPEVSTYKEYLQSRKELDDESNVERIRNAYLTMGLRSAFITELSEEFLTNYRPGDCSRIIIEE